MLLSALLFIFLGHANTTDPEVQLTPACAGKESLLNTSFLKTCDLGNGRQLDILFAIERKGKERIPYSWWEIEKKDGVFDGTYVEWSKLKTFKRISGAFSKGLPSGTWTLSGYNTKDHYDLKYQNGNLNEIVINKGSEKPEVIKVEKLDATETSLKREIGYFSNSGIDPYIPGDYVSDRMTMDHILFYSAPDKKKVVGVAVSDYRFFPSHVCKSTVCDSMAGSDNHQWLVAEKKEDMCKTLMPARNLSIGYQEQTHYYELWFDCSIGFRDIYESYLNALLGISKNAIFYDAPVGKVVKVDAGEKHQGDKNFGAEILEKKMVGKEIWVKIKISTGQCRDDEEEHGEYWVPFLINSEPNLIHYSHGC